MCKLKSIIFMFFSFSVFKIAKKRNIIISKAIRLELINLVILIRNKSRNKNIKAEYKINTLQINEKVAFNECLSYR